MNMISATAQGTPGAQGDASPCHLQEFPTKFPRVRSIDKFLFGLKKNTFHPGQRGPGTITDIIFVISDLKNLQVRSNARFLYGLKQTS